MPDIKKIMAMAAVPALWCAVIAASIVFFIVVPVSLLSEVFDFGGWWIAVPIFFYILGVMWLKNKIQVREFLKAFQNHLNYGVFYLISAVVGLSIIACWLAVFGSLAYRAYHYLKEGYNPTVTIQTLLNAKPFETDWVGIHKMSTWVIGQQWEWILIIISGIIMAGFILLSIAVEER